MMNSKNLLLALALACGLVFVLRLSAPTPAVNFPVAGPICTLKQRVGLTNIEVVYSRPRVEHYTIFGGLAPHGTGWCTGVSQTAKITFSTPVKLEGNDFPADAYALFVMPDENEWTVIINREADQCGAVRYNGTDGPAWFKVAPKHC